MTQSTDIGNQILRRDIVMEVAEPAAAVRSTNSPHPPPATEKRSVIHLQYLGWPDDSPPTSHADVRRLQEESDTVRALSLLDGPPVVHCSAGIGRSGTFM